MDARSSRLVGLALAATATAPKVSAQTPADFARADSAFVRLQPSSSPQRPAAIRGNLQQRGCLVPQSFAERYPHNVIHGALLPSTPEIR